MMAFRGWPAEALEFFEGLEADNSKSYWQRHKETYETLVRAPMEELLAELAPEWGEGRIFRPYRDVRFSADKSPYKTNIAATIGDGYLHLDARGLGTGAGMWEMAPDQLGDERPSVESPLKRLYFTGHWTRPGGGITPVMISAMQAAQLITGTPATRSPTCTLPRSTRIMSEVAVAMGLVREARSKSVSSVMGVSLGWRLRKP